jgi:TonB-dependent SusC/RagA subfamily outer membrane receptor
MRYVLLSAGDWSDASRREILAHELEHVRKGHSFDLLLIEALSILQWFNPAVWLLKRELRHVHEYEADASLLQQGIDAKKYQLLLIRKAVGTARFMSLANSFTHSSLKKRIKMMLKKQSHPWAKLKYLCVLPLAACALTIFARPEVSHIQQETPATNVNEPIRMQQSPDTVTLAPRTKREDLVKAAKTLSIKQQADAEAKKDSFRTGIPSVNPPLIFIDGKESTKAELDAVLTDTVESLSVLKDAAAVAAYGEKGAHGVILVVTKKDK